MALPEVPGSLPFASAELFDPLVRPDDFFARDGADHHLSPSRFVLAAFCVLVGVAGPGMAAVAILFPEILASNAVRLLPKLLGLIFVVGTALLLIWVAFGILLHVASRLVGGAGAFSDALTVAAYGLGPLIVVGVLVVVGVLGYTFTPLSPDFPTVEAYRDFLDRTKTTVEPYSNLLAGLWQWYVWTFGLKRVRNLSTPRAALAAGATVVATSLWLVV